MTNDSCKNALIIFTRNPELGKCKTRLAQTIGNEAALNIYKHLLNHTSCITKNVNADKFVFYSENMIENDIWDTSTFTKKLQKGNDLGERMMNAFTEIFNLGYHNVIIIGSDLLDLNTEIIDEAYNNLETLNYVIGPAKDGGYYLLGMNTLNTILFENKIWGSSSVLKNTLEDLQSKSVFLLEELNDIDTFEDITPYNELKIYYESIN